jgi:hypothetical protein
MLSERGIERAWVETVLRAPEWDEADPKDARAHRAFGRIGEAKGKVLRVVYTNLGDERLVITAFFDRDASKPGG